jgi:uncharacterized membrane protein YgcG
MATEYLVQFGLAGYVGRFVSAADYARGTAVLVRTVRGTEVGGVLGIAGGVATAALAHFTPGTIERALTDADAPQQTALAELATRVPPLAQALADAQQLGVQVLEAEALWAGPLIVQVLAWHPEPLDAWVQALADTVGRPVLLHDVTRPPAPVAAASGCGKSDCGSGGCSSCGSGGGCSSGSCSRGTFTSAAEVRAYFAGLREQLHAQTGRVPLA